MILQQCDCLCLLYLQNISKIFSLTIPLYQTAPTGRTWLELHNAGEHHLSVKGLSFRHMRSEAGRQTIDFS